MKHFKTICVVIFLCSFLSTTAQNNYRSHTVKKGETVFSIANEYEVSTEAIYRLNPDARNGVQTDTILIIPSADSDTNYNQQVIDFKQHKVRRKETLFSIAQKYDITVDDIKRYNKRLYSEPLRKGDRIMIPLGLKNIEVTTTTTSNGSDNGTVTIDSTTVTTATNKIHIVLPKETKYGIARKYNITIAQLQEMNPTMGEPLQIGSELNVPDTEVVSNTTIEDEQFEFYEVKPKEGFFRLKVKFGVTKDEVIALNPYAVDGLKEGMILKLPKASSSQNAATSANVVDLSYQINNTETKNVVVMLPFSLSKASRDSLEANQDLIRSSRTLAIALDFYSGVLMAADFAKDKGISVNLDIMDTEGKESKVSQLISSKNFREVDAVIGPLFQKNVSRASNELNRYDTPVLSPLSNQEAGRGNNYFQTIPTKTLLENRMIDYLVRNKEDNNIIIIADAKHATQKARLINEFPNAKVLNPREGNFLYVVDIEKNIDRMTKNWVVLASDNPVLVSNAIGLLNGLPIDREVRLFTLDKNDAFDFEDVQNVKLGKLQLTYPSVSKSYDYKNPSAFVTSYKNKYGVLPNRFAVRGFDVTYDVLLRLAMGDSLYKALDVDGETEYEENKFFYVRSGGRYSNNAAYIMKYTENLLLEVVE
ncbi:MAG: LysM peptidoglycan-binding domain-containing protein [Gilvibacter sp.]